MRLKNVKLNEGVYFNLALPSERIKYQSDTASNEDISTTRHNRCQHFICSRKIAL